LATTKIKPKAQRGIDKNFFRVDTVSNVSALSYRYISIVTSMVWQLLLCSPGLHTNKKQLLHLLIS